MLPPMWDLLCCIIRKEGKVKPKIRLIMGSAFFSVGTGGLAAWMLTHGAQPLPLYAVLVAIGLMLILIEIQQSYSQ